MNTLDKKTEVFLLILFFFVSTWCVWFVRTRPIPATVFSIAEHLCKANDGVKYVARNVTEDQYDIRCNNTAEFRTVSVILTIKKGESLGSTDKSNTN